MYYLVDWNSLDFLIKKKTYSIVNSSSAVVNTLSMCEINEDTLGPVYGTPTIKKILINF